MTRLAPCLAVATAVLMLAAPALAADFGGDDFGSDSGLKSSFSSDDWANSDANDPLSFEFGFRYWYSSGAQNFNAGPFSLQDNDHTQAGEAHFRIDDASTKTYVKGFGGLSFDINGQATGTGILTPTDVTNGHVDYGSADIGYSWLGDGKKGPSFGPFAGYAYWNDSPNMGRANYTVGTTTGDFSYNGVSVVGPGDSQENNIEVNALRLGFSGRTTFGSLFDLTGELAAVPYANIHGTLGALGVADDVSVPGYVRMQSSAADINGWGYGAMAEAMVGIHPTDNLTLRVGGRAWYLQGRSDTSFDTVTVTDDVNHTVVGTQRYITTANPWSLFRYGGLAELTYNF